MIENWSKELDIQMAAEVIPILGSERTIKANTKVCSSST